MADSMRDALDKINAKEKENQRERETKDRDEFKRITASQKAVKGKSVTSIKSAKERYDELMKQNAPSTSALVKTGLMGLSGGPLGMITAGAKIIGAQMKASGASREETVNELMEKGVSREEAESVVDRAIRGDSNITSDRFSDSRGPSDKGSEKLSPALQNVITDMQGSQSATANTPVYTEGVGYTGGGYQNYQTPGNQYPGQNNQIVQASQQGLTGFGGYGQPVIPTNAQQFSQTPQDFWTIAAQLAMENK